MAVIDLRETDFRERHGLITETVTLPSQSKKKSQEHSTRGEMRAAIMRALYAAGEPMTRLDICKAIGRAKTPHLIGIIEELVSDGLVCRDLSSWRGVAAMFLYEVCQ